MTTVTVSVESDLEDAHSVNICRTYPKYIYDIAWVIVFVFGMIVGICCTISYYH